MDSADQSRTAPVIDTSVAHPARRYNYWLGGKDHFQADRESGDAIAELFPTIRIAAMEGRKFLRRVVTYLAAEAGIRQFLDIGTGIPTADNTHEVAQRIAPESRIVYVDNDPIVLTHARALLTSSQPGKTAYIDADLRNPEAILADRALRDTLDFTQPIALMLIAVLHFVLDEFDPYGIVRRLVDALPSGSYVALTCATDDFMPAELREVAQHASATKRFGDMRLFTLEQTARFFEGLDLIDPGVVSVSEWRPEERPEDRPTAFEISGLAGLARKP